MELVKTDETLTRNGITVPLYQDEFGKLSKENSGKKFLCPLFDSSTPEAFASSVKFTVGDPIIPNNFISTKLTKVFRSIFGQIMLKAWDAEKGEVDQDVWNELAQDFTEGEEKRDDLLADKQELADKFSELTDSEEFKADYLKFAPQLAELNAKTTAINASLKRIQEEIDAKTAKRNATKAANAAKLAAANAASIADKAATVPVAA